MKGAEGHTGTEGWMDGKMAEWLVMSQCALSGAWCYGCVPVCVCTWRPGAYMCVSGHKAPDHYLRNLLCTPLPPAHNGCPNQEQESAVLLPGLLPPAWSQQEGSEPYLGVEAGL